MTAGDDEPDGVVGWLRWFHETDRGVVVYVREALSSILAVMLVGALLFAVSGIWPPMVAVESGSMQPHMERGDLVFVMEEHRLAPDRAYGDTGVVTHRIGQQTGYTRFGAPGDVIVYKRDGNRVETPIIHRAMFWVNDSENWYKKADSDSIGGADNCEELRHCPAPHAGFITKGDNDATNRNYDQVSGLSGPVKPRWVVGTAEFSIPWLGNIRLWATGGVAAAETGHSTSGGVVEAKSDAVVPVPERAIHVSVIERWEPRIEELYPIVERHPATLTTAVSVPTSPPMPGPRLAA